MKLKQRFLSMILSVALSACLPFSLQARLSESHEALSRATFALYGQLDDERHFLCTAEAYERSKDGSYKLITAGHCITGDDLPEGLKFFVAEDTVSSDLMPVEVLKAESSDNFDFAILSLKTDKAYPLVHLAPEGRPVSEPESIVVNVNFSMGVTKEVVLGRVASGVIPNKGANGDCSVCMGRFMVNIDNGPGASGSAIMDEGSKEVIGLVEAGSSRLPGIDICNTINSFWIWQHEAGQKK